jgi:outer membrane immunogenic protein
VARAQQTVDASARPAPDTAAAARVAPAPRQAPPSFQWTGFYVGGSAGYGGGDAGTTFRGLYAGDTFTFDPDTLEPEPMGWTVGFHGGVNFRWTTFVVGGEADFTKAQVAGNLSVTPFTFDNSPVNGTMFTDQGLNWFSTFRGRFGVATPRALYFVTTGLAVGGLDHDSNVSAGGTQYASSESGAQLGWTIGGGVEGVITNSLTWRAQYLYLDLGESTNTGNPVPANPGFTIDYRSISRNHLFNAGISFRF